MTTTTAANKNWNVQDNIEIGITQFYERQFHDAYTCFTTALNLEPNNETALMFRAKTALQLYDHRRNTAQDDIEAAIKVNPFKGQLYLLENQILRSRPGNIQEAAKRLQKAQFKIFHDDPDLQKIRQLVPYQKSTQLNHVVQMPPEVVYTIMSLLPFRSRVHCLGVSHRWRNVLRSISDLWRDLDYSQPIITRNNVRMVAPALHYSEASIASSLDRFIQWVNIRKLTVPLTTGIFEKLISRRPALVEVSFLGGMITVDPLVLQLVMREIGSTWRKVEFDSAIKPFVFYHAASMYCPELTELTIHQGHWHHNMPSSVAQLLRPIPTLTTLCLCHCNFSTMFPIISQICPELTDLTIEGSDQIMLMTTDFYTMLRNASKLCRLTLRDRYPKHPRGLIEFIQNRPLDWLDVDHFPLTREGVLGLVDAMQAGSLKCYDKVYSMNCPDARKELKKAIDQKQPQIPLNQQQLQEDYFDLYMDGEPVMEDEDEYNEDYEDDFYNDVPIVGMQDLIEEFYYSRGGLYGDRYGLW